MMEKVTGLRLEDKGEETESRVTQTGANQESEEAAGNVRTEEMITGVEDEGEIRTEERKEICAGTPLMATHAYTKNQASHVGKEIDLRQWDTLIFKRKHAENEHRRLVQDRNGQVGYAPAAFLVVILNTTAEEQERDATKKGQGNSTEDNRIGGRRGWPSTGWWSGLGRKRMWDMWTCGTALWGMKNCILEMAYILVERGLPIWPRDCQGRLPVAWIKYDI